MQDKGGMDTEDIILGKAKYEDWRSIYRNVWSYCERNYSKQCTM